MKFLAIVLLLQIVMMSFADITVYRGTLCGWGDPGNLKQILCDGLNPRDGCPSGYTQQRLSHNVAYCYKTNTTTRKERSLNGTLCGGLARTQCGGFNPYEKCPPGYTQIDQWICAKSDPTVEDASGTVCGVKADYVGQTCNGLPVGKCPDGYYPIDSEREEDWHACFKK